MTAIKPISAAIITNINMIFSLASTVWPEGTERAKSKCNRVYSVLTKHETIPFYYRAVGYDRQPLMK